MRNDQIITRRRERDCPDILLKKTNTRPTNSILGERNHSTARFDTIDLRLWVYRDKLLQKAPVSFANYQNSSR